MEAVGAFIPHRDRQRERLDPIFQRLRDVLEGNSDPLGLRLDPSGIAPERALVFEVAGSIGDFNSAVSKIDGLSFLADEELILVPDDDFGVQETRKGRTLGIRQDKLISGRLYMAMPDIRALRGLLSLWTRFKKGDDPSSGFAPWFRVFQHLHALRAWGAERPYSD